MEISATKILMTCVPGFMLLRNGYMDILAATGIGTQYGGVQIDFNAVKGNIDIVPLDNDWQRAAHDYSDDVLISHRTDTEKETPKFERGKLLTDQSLEMIYISGTAAIRGEESIMDGNVLSQTEITLENIQHLIGLEEGKKNLPGIFPGQIGASSVCT